MISTTVPGLVAAGAVEIVLSVWSSAFVLFGATSVASPAKMIPDFWMAFARGYLLHPLLIVSVAAYWWAAKVLARTLEKPLLWDAVDMLAGLLLGVGVAIVELGVTVLKAGHSVSAELVALRYGAVAVLFGSIMFWVATILLEDVGGVERPDGVPPMPERVWETYLGWVPLLGNTNS